MDNHKQVLSAEDMQKMLGLKGGFGRAVAKLVNKFLDIEKVNVHQAKHADAMGPDFAKAVLAEEGVTYDIPAGQLDYIPAEGGFITVSNHHYGSIDGMILTDLIVRKRPEYRILTTFLLARIPNIKDWFIPVNNLSTGDTRTVSGIRAALAHIGAGNPLGLFPAGEVATWQKKDKRSNPKKRVVEDKPWAENMMKLIHHSGFPVVPIYFDGGNSLSFHLLGCIHPRLRTVRLAHEMMNKKGRTVHVRIGKPIPAEELAKYTDQQLSTYLRSCCYALEKAAKE